MKFDIKDVKSWANRHDVKIGDEGYFINDLESFKEDRADNSEVKIDRIKGIRDEFGNCFISAKLYCLQDCFPFFLPLKAVKVDKPEKKYRPIKNMFELADIMYGEDRQRGSISTGDLMTLERKKDRFRFRILITQLEYENDLKLVSINDKTLKNLFDDYNVMNVNGVFVPFGVEVEND